MSKPYTGGCACGAIRYEISAEPIAMNDCQCRDCQSTSGTGRRILSDLPGQGGGEARGRSGRIGTWSARAGT